MSSPSRYVDDSAPAQPRVLLVDDEPVTLMVTSAALREHGFLVREASGGQEALDLVTESVPDIVVLDARMPGLDGFETCRSLRARPGFENLPVLMLTGLDDDASITRAYQAGATDFFVKSNQWSLLDGRLRYLLRASRTRQEPGLAKSGRSRREPNPIAKNQVKLEMTAPAAHHGSKTSRQTRSGVRLLSCPRPSPIPTPTPPLPKASRRSAPPTLRCGHG